MYVVGDVVILNNKAVGRIEHIGALSVVFPNSHYVSLVFSGDKYDLFDLREELKDIYSSIEGRDGLIRISCPITLFDSNLDKFKFSKKQNVDW